MSRKWLVALPVLILLFVVGCASQADHDALEVRVTNIELWLTGNRGAVTPNPADETMEEWGKRVGEALCVVEDLAGAPVATQLCPNTGGGGDGDPPPAPPFL